MLKRWLAVAFACALLLAGCADGNNELNTNSENNNVENANENQANANVENEAGSESEENDANAANKENAENENNSNNTEVEDNPDQVIDSEAVSILEKSVDAMSKVNSYRMTTSSKQQMSSADGSEELVNVKIEAAINVDPLTYFLRTSMPDPLTGTEIVSDQYLYDGTIYTVDSISGQTYKVSLSDEESESLDLEMSPEEQLKLMKSMINELHLEEDGNYYVLSVKGSGDALLGSMLEEMDIGLEELMNQTSINKFEYVVYIDKDNYYQEEFAMNLEMGMTLDLGFGGEAQSLVIHQEIKSTFYDFDAVGQIEVPEQVINEAISFEEMF